MHTDDSITFTASGTYCGADYQAHAPADCASANTRTDKPADQLALIWFLCAFTPQHHPQVGGLQFGVDHNLPPGQGYVPQYSSCGVLENPDAGWPDTSPSGNLVGFASPMTDTIFPFYWFAAYGQGPGSYFGTGVYPGIGKALVADLSVPPVEDQIFKFGRVEWQGPGTNDCPEPPLLGGCCFQDDARCEVVDYTVCADSSGVYLGDGSSCDLCSACCYSSGENRVCIVTTEAECMTRVADPTQPLPTWSGVFNGISNLCTTNGTSADSFWFCNETATRVSTWGALKSLFR